MASRTLSVAIALACSCTAAVAQIPNGGFEQWVDQGGYTEPTNWLTYNDVLTPQGYFITCEAGTPGAADNYHATITSRTPAGGSTVQGWMSAGENGCCAGFPCTERPAMLTGQWQYGIQPSDTGFVMIALSAWNGSSGGPEIIAIGTLEITGNIGAWTSFSVPFTYLSNATPDTAYIQFAASKDFLAPVEGSFMKVDDLAFVGIVGIEEAVTTPQFDLFPSPAADVLHIAGNERIAGLVVVDLSGRTVMIRTMNTEHITLDVQDLPAGRYFVHGRMAGGTRGVRSFVKQ